MSAPAGAREPTLQSRGSSQGGLRIYNERVVLQAVRHGALPAAEIARVTKLTAQTVSMISKRLLDDGLLIKGEPQRGRVGQPSVPLSLNPNGALSIGIKVGRRSMDVLLVDFTGSVRQRYSLSYQHADVEVVLKEIGKRLADVWRGLPPAQRKRLQGVGIAAPQNMGGWQSLLGMPQALAARWQVTDLRAEVERLCDWPVHLVKDTAAACVAELVAGQGHQVRSFLYVFVDTFIGGALVLDGQLRGGLRGNAGAVGSLPLALAQLDGEVAPAQLLSMASLLSLEQSWRVAALDTAATNDDRALQAPWLSHTQAWLEQAACGIAQALNTAACLLDLEGVIVDGSIGRALLRALLTQTEAAMGRYNWEGITPPRLLAGTIGSDARAIGGAMLPLHANFAPDRDLFLKLQT